MIRAAEKRDADEIALVRRRACRVAYEEFVDPGLLDESEDVGVWRKRLEEPRGAIILVAEEGERIAGFAAAGAYDGSGVLQALYVDPVAQGAGVGLALHDEILSLLRERGDADVQAWLLAEDEAGRAFFENRGWEQEDGIEDNDPDWGLLVFRYRLEL